MKKPAYTQGNVMVAAALSIALLFVVFAYQLAAPGESQVDIQTETLAPVLSEYLPEEDSDGDGLPDWQEILIGTNPHNRDTDGDGTLDAYTPISTPIITSTSTEGAIVSPAAQELGDLFINQYASFKQSGNYNAENIQSFGKDLAANLNAQVPFEPYTSDDIKTDSDTSYERVLEYRDGMKSALAPLLSLPGVEFEMYARFADNGDTDALNSLKKSASLYESAATHAVSLTVPRDARTVHLNAVNSLAYYAAVLHDVVRYSYDPVVSFVLLRTFSEAENNVFKAFNALSSYYVAKYQEHAQ